MQDRGATLDGERASSPELKDLRGELGRVRQHVLDFEREMESLLASEHPDQEPSARNLIDYLGLRQLDLRELQDQLASVGLSSLGRSEGQVMAALEAVLGVLDRLLGYAPQDGPSRPAGVRSMAEGEQRLATQTLELLGPEPESRTTRIMVTLDGVMLDQPGVIRDLIRSGMNCARINCAHDDAETWAQLAREVRAAASDVGRPCLVDMDLPGPKLRTGPIASRGGVVRWRAQRNNLGEIVGPASVWLTPAEAPEAEPSTAQGSLPLPGAWLAKVEPGDTLVVRDTRDRKRRLQIVTAVGANRLAECERSAYVAGGARISHRRSTHRAQRPTHVGALPEEQDPLVLRPGDVLEVTEPDIPGGPAELDAWGELIRPARIGCTAPEIFSDVRVGQAIWFDDGKIGGDVTAVSPHGLRVEILYADPEGAKLRADKGINLPDSELRLPALGEQDLAALAAVSANADMVALSFANRPEDVEALRTELARRTERRVGIILKIETRRGFRNLPRMLLDALRARPVGVMIARGDLAVECGYERLAEVQEEMLWLCEAAHVPVIWATQVLEQLAKSGRPSRAEITDAAMGVRAECVMLNKGPHTIDAVRTLDDILSRMQMHQRKKRTLFRRLSVSFATVDDAGDDELEDSAAVHVDAA